MGGQRLPYMDCPRAAAAGSLRRPSREFTRREVRALTLRRPLQCGISAPSMSGSNSVIRPCRLNVRFARKRTRLTPLAGLGRSAGQGPLHGLHAAGIAAADNDAEIGARLPERLLVNVGLGGCILDDARRLGATCELLAQELLRARARSRGWRRPTCCGHGHGLAAGARARSEPDPRG